MNEQIKKLWDISTSKISTVWNQLGLGTKLLAIVEPMSYLAGMAAISFHLGWIYFFGTGSVLLMGVWIANANKSDSGRTLTQLYEIDVLVHILGAAHYIADFSGFAQFLGELSYNSVIIALSLAKVWAITEMVSMPGRSGWPNLNPFAKHLRDIPASPRADIVVYTVLLFCLGVGFWIASNHGNLTKEVWVIPLILSLAVDARAITVRSTSEKTMELAKRFEAMSEDEQNIVESMMDHVRDAKRKELEKEGKSDDE